MLVNSSQASGFALISLPLGMLATSFPNGLDCDHMNRRSADGQCEGPSTFPEGSPVAETRIEWKRVAAEVAAIVFGILIAFWIDAEWQRRQEMRAEQEVLASLEADLQSSLDGLRSHWLPMHFGALQATAHVLGQALDLPAGTMDFSGLPRMWDGTSPDTAAMAVTSDDYESMLAIVSEKGSSTIGDVALPDSLIGAALTTATYDPTVTSLNSLLADGGLNRIRDRGLRAALSSLPGQLADAQDEERAARDHVDRRLRPLFEAAGDMTVVNFVHWNWLETFAPGPSGLVTLQLSRELLGALALRVPQQTAVVSELALFANALEETLELIRAQRR